VNAETTERERERETRRKVGEEVRATTSGEGQETISSVLKVSRQCLFVLVEVMHMIGIIFLYDVTNHTILSLLALTEDVDLFGNVETLYTLNLQCSYSV
jgi:hypothetical protein